MSVYKNIKDATYQIKLLKKRLPHVKDKRQQKNLLNLINSFIRLLNDCETLLDNNMQTDVIDRLILASIYTKMWAAPTGASIDIFEIVKNIDENIEDSKELQKWRIINFLRQKEIENIIENLPYKRTKTGLHKLVAAPNEITDVCGKMDQVTTIEEYDAKIENLLIEFKQYIQWN